MDKKRVLVVDGEIRKSLSVVRSLGKDYEVFVLSAYAWSISSASKYCAKSFVRTKLPVERQIVSICEQHSIDLLIATQEETLIKLGKVYDELIELGVIPTFPRFNVLDKALDKSKTFRIAEQCGVLIPKTIYPASMQEINDMADDLTYPIVVKPIRSISIDGESTVVNSGPSYAMDTAELRKIVNGFPSSMEVPVLQEYIDGTGIGGFFLVDKSGEIVNHFAHERIRDVNPKGSGSCFRKSVKIEPGVLEASTKLLKGMEWEGVAMVEFRKSTSGEYYLMEVNGRFWGSLDLARQAGLNFPKGLVESCLGLEVKQPNYKNNVHVRWFLGDILRFFRILKGKPSNYPGSYPSRLQGIMELFDRRNFNAKLEVLKLADPMPFVAEILSVVRK